MQYLENTPFDELKIGDTASNEHTLTAKDLILFAAASGDYNPIHLDEDYAATTPFKQCIAHGAWTASLISAAIAMRMPGPGTVYFGQNFKFLRPAYVGDILTVSLEITAKNEQNKHVNITCSVINQKGKKLIVGKAEVLAPTEKIKIEQSKLPAINFV